MWSQLAEQHKFLFHEFSLSVPYLYLLRFVIGAHSFPKADKLITKICSRSYRQQRCLLHISARFRRHSINYDQGSLSWVGSMPAYVYLLLTSSRRERMAYYMKTPLEAAKNNPRL